MPSLPLGSRRRLSPSVNEPFWLVSEILDTMQAKSTIGCRIATLETWKYKSPHHAGFYISG
jgi:hypothetical protein